MARAGPSRSQRAAPEPSQSQRLSQSQRARRGRQDDDDDEDGDEGDGMDVDEETGENELTRKANELVRLALFTEQKRSALRKDDINKKVLGSNTRQFNVVLAEAQKILKKTFGMDLVELRSRAGLDGEATAGAAAESGTGLKKKAASAGSKTYILRSTLSPTLIELASVTHESILEEEAADAAFTGNDDDETPIRNYGSILSWSTGDQLGTVGVLYVILGLILLSGKSIGDMDLRTHLKRLRLPPTSTLSLTPLSAHSTIPIEAYLNQLTRQGYLDRFSTSASKSKPSATQTGAKRLRGTQGGGGDGEGASFEWKWGPRAMSEVGELGVAKFVLEFIAERSVVAENGEDGGEGERSGRRRKEEIKKKYDLLMKGLVRVTGELSDVK
ncbi:hypothetical protein JAAARDRAFT_257770 [Jaapia argillacea MUCL 33604]|uniref:MAGE domain-containing protein n=1 Tax=Jaapia argillacea MUCL 33604 TaxID=933084 RepID=A0A067PTI6_9AGAM|nr:hypothetical protein JAAARDRAFT_257770 [Jaapia argillacea MUCL 33604]